MTTKCGPGKVYHPRVKACAKKCPGKNERRGKDGVCPSMRPKKQPKPAAPPKIVSKPVQRKQVLSDTKAAEAGEFFFGLGGLKAVSSNMSASFGNFKQKYRIPKRR